MEVRGVTGCLKPQNIYLINSGGFHLEPVEKQKAQAFLLQVDIRNINMKLKTETVETWVRKWIF